MTQTQHTPGPWKVGEPLPTGIRQDAVVRITASDASVVATIFSHWPNSTANARLIAAAPELLVALERAAVRMDDIGAAHYDPDGAAEIRALLNRLEV